MAMFRMASLPTDRLLFERFLRTAKRLAKKRRPEVFISYAWPSNKEDLQV
jgi:hypothetical protein